MKMRNKADLPQKTCPVCRRPFTWRKKWAKDWGRGALLLGALPAQRKGGTHELTR